MYVLNIEESMPSRDTAPARVSTGHSLDEPRILPFTPGRALSEIDHAVIVSECSSTPSSDRDQLSIRTTLIVHRTSVSRDRV